MQLARLLVRRLSLSRHLTGALTLGRTSRPARLVCSSVRQTGSREAFFAAIEASNLNAAWRLYKEASAAKQLNKYMLGAIVRLAGQRDRTELVEQLWGSLSSGGAVPQLDAHLCSDFILAFGAVGDLDTAAAVRPHEI